MADYSTYKNTPLTVNAADDYIDSGWKLSEGIATHSECNPGELKLPDISIQIGVTHIIEFEVLNYGSGVVTPRIGTVTGTPANDNGFHRVVLPNVNDVVLTFYADGLVSITNINVYKEAVEPVCVAFSEDISKWVSYYSYLPDNIINFIDKLFMFKDGTLWMNNVNPLRNNFFGVQYKSEVEFYVNNNPTSVKLFFSMRVQSNKKWSSPDEDGLLILPTEGKPNGMKSRLKLNRFRNLQGDFFADFLRNTIDPRFNDPNVSLFKGEPLRGRIMKVKLENSDNTEVVLFQIDIKSAPSNYTY